MKLNKNSVLCHSRKSLSGISSLLNKRRDPRLQISGMTEETNIGETHCVGFTLIELLVVVLIIGILAAIAVPQYEKSVARARAAQGITMLKSVYQAALEYQMANGTWPEKFAELSVSPSWTTTQKWYEVEHIRDVLSNDMWSLNIAALQERLQGLTIGQLTGRYTGGGFVMWNKYNSFNKMPLDSIVCAEVIAKITTPGDFCQKVMQSKKQIYTGSSLRYYEMP